MRQQLSVAVLVTSHASEDDTTLLNDMLAGMTYTGMHELSGGGGGGGRRQFLVNVK